MNILGLFLFMIFLPLIYIGIFIFMIYFMKWVVIIVAIMFGDKEVIHEFNCADKNKYTWKDAWKDLTYVPTERRAPCPEYLKWKAKQQEQEPHSILSIVPRKEE